MGRIDPKVRCGECDAPMILRHTVKHRYPDGKPRLFFGCSNYPDCKGTHGAHPDGTPVGVPADPETKKYRRSAHEAFDAWRDRRFLNKNRGYHLLSAAMEVDELHIGACDIDDCKKIIELCNQGVEV